MSTELWWAWLATMTVISLTPGAGAVASMSSGAAHGWRRGLWTAVGQQLALAAELTVVALGLASLLHAWPALFLALQAVGVLYLAWLGGSLLLASTHPAPAGEKTARRRIMPSTPMGMVRHGFIVNATNPKALLSLFAIAPRFLDPAQPMPVQYLVMGLTMVVVDMIIMSGYTAAGARLLRRLEDPEGHRRTDRIFGAVFLVAAALLVFV
jgi:homoserine/homoserine lactone efflux protein